MKKAVFAVNTVNSQRTRKGSKMINYDYYSIGTEFDAAWGKSNVADMELETPGPENKREIPCELPCENATKCMNEGLECSAFRNWTAKGDFKDSDVGRYLRAMK